MSGERAELAARALAAIDSQDPELIEAAFERNPYLRDIVKVRVYDEAGKHADLATPPFAYYATMVQRVVDAYCGRPAQRAG